MHQTITLEFPALVFIHVIIENVPNTKHIYLFQIETKEYKSCCQSGTCFLTSSSLSTKGSRDCELSLKKTDHHDKLTLHFSFHI